MKFPSIEEMAEQVAERAINEYTYEGKTIKEWIEIIDKSTKVTYLCDRKACEDCNIDGECHHTFNIDHAVNFKKIGDGYYEEKERNVKS